MQRLLLPAEAANRIGITPETLKKWRKRNEGPPYVYTPSGFIRYREADLHDWIKSLTPCS